MADSNEYGKDIAAAHGDAWAPWRTRINASRRRRDERVQEWQQNVDLRKGSFRHTRETIDRLDARTSRSVSTNQDWPLTKAKLAQLYSQTPEVRLSPRDERFRLAIAPFGRELNETIERTSVGSTIEETLADIVNAAGIGGALVSCEQRTEQRIDPVSQQSVAFPVDIRYLVQRISPADLLVPDDFTGSNYDHARWLGEDGCMTWPQAVTNLGLTEDVKEQVLGKNRRAAQSLNTDTTTVRDTDVVSYTQIFYWRHFYHADETSFTALQRVVFVDGMDEPAINEPYRAQKRTADGRLIGVTKNPIRVCTLTYISDENLPPSDSSIGRGAVDELEESRTDMALQRLHSIPIRWADSNRVSQGTRSLLEKGTFQGFIMTNGPGDRAVGEVARASFPPEKFEIDRIIKGELTELWQVGSNQAGAFATGERSAREAGIIERNFQRRVGQEQDKVSKYFLGIAEVLAGHLALYGTFDLPDEIGPMRQELANGFTYSVRVDATVRLDADEQIDRLTKGLNLTAQSGYVNLKPVIEKIWELLGEDPAKVVIDPQPKPPEPVKVNVSDAINFRDPIVLATMMRTQQAPTPQDLSAAIALLQSASMMVAPPVAQAGPNGHPPREVQTPGIANPDWEAAPRIDRRSEDGGL
jgi:hypothetical protein